LLTGAAGAPRDLAHNLVLARAACNSRTSGLIVDRAVSIAVAEWSYGHAERVQAEVWLGGTECGHLSAEWRGLLA